MCHIGGLFRLNSPGLFLLNNSNSFSKHKGIITKTRIALIQYFKIRKKESPEANIKFVMNITVKALSATWNKSLFLFSLDRLLLSFVRTLCGVSFEYLDPFSNKLLIVV